MNLILLFNEYVKLLLTLENESKKGNGGTYQYHCIVVTKHQIRNKFIELILTSTGQDIDMLLTSIENECEKLKSEIEIFEFALESLSNNKRDSEEQRMISFADYRLEYLNRKLQKYTELSLEIRNFTSNKVYKLELN